MKQTFKTTLLAASLAAAMGSAVAGTMVVDMQTHSVEGLKSYTAAQTSNAIKYTLGTGYLAGDKITFTYSADVLKGVTPTSSITVSKIDSDDVKVAKVGLAMSRIAFGDNYVTYRVTNVEQPKKADGSTPHSETFDTTGIIIDLGTVSYAPSVIADGASLKVTASSQDATGDVIDNSGTLSAVIAQSKSQFTGKTTVSGFDATINVSAMRKAFVSGTTDTASFTYAPTNTTGWLNLATVNSTTATIAGEKGKMTSLTKAEFASAQAGTVTLDVENALLTVAYTGTITTDTITFTPPTGDKAVVLEAQDFTASLAYGYTSKGSATGSVDVAKNASAGSWDLNGATVNIPYMPYGPNASQIVYVSNDSDQDADITVTVFDDKGNLYDLGALQIKAGKKRVTKIAPEINDRLRAAGFNGTKASITITVNAPDSDVTVYASYNVGGADRGYINTDQYKGK